MTTASNRLGASSKKKSKVRRKQVSGIIRDAAEETIEQVRKDAAEVYEEGRDKLHGVVSNIEHYVRDQPVKSILIGAGIGLLFGRFWMRR